MPKGQADITVGVDDYQITLRSHGVELLLTSAGQFGAHLTSVKLRQLRLLCVQENMARVAYLKPAPALAVVTFPAGSAPEMSWAGAPLGRRDVVFHGHDEQIHQDNGRLPLGHHIPVDQRSRRSRLGDSSSKPRPASGRPGRQGAATGCALAAALAPEVLPRHRNQA